jgi:hypothetical protein
MTSNASNTVCHLGSETCESNSGKRGEVGLRTLAGAIRVRGPRSRAQPRRPLTRLATLADLSPQAAVEFTLLAGRVED